MRANTGHGIFRTADGLQSVAWVGDRTYVRGDRFERPVAWEQSQKRSISAHEFTFTTTRRRKDFRCS
jgi:hypothetical protein